MHPELSNVASHMRKLGLNSLAHAIHLLLSPYLGDSDFGDYKNDLAVLQAAHAGEILGKAAIAEQHPLLIFSRLPKSTQAKEDWLGIKALFEAGRTVGYQDIPERLWATTGYKIKEVDLYQEFGKLHNSIQHFASIKDSNYLTYQTLRFVFGIVDPLIHHFWELYAVNCIESGFYGDEHKQNYDKLLFWEIDFLVPEEFRDYYEAAKERMDKQSHRGPSLLEQDDEY